jgi:hypothetical protein
MARGARPGNRNALKHGRYAARMRALRQEVRAALSASRFLLRELTLPAPAGCDFMSSDKRGLGAGPPTMNSSTES